MKRTLPVTIAALVVMFGSFLTSLLGASMLLLLKTPMETPPETPYSMHTLAIGGFVFWCLLAVLGFSTAIGIFQRWRWARYSMIGFGTMLAVVALISIPVVLMMSRFLPAGASTEGIGVVTVFVGGFYLLLGILGGWFAYLFSRRRVAEYFRGDAAEIVGVKRPVPITIVAALMLIGVFGLPIVFTSSMPLFFLGQLLHGAVARIVFVVWMAGYAVIGFALLRMKSWAWTAAMAMFVFGLVNQLCIFLPGRLGMFDEALRNFAAYKQAPQSMIIGERFGLIVGAVSILLPVCLLLASRMKYEAACAESERLALIPPEQASL